MPTLLAPRPIAPLSTAAVTSQTPTLQWELPSGADGAHVELCRDRACTAPISAWDAKGAKGKPPQPLAAGVVFWRLTATTNGMTGTTLSPTWQFNVGHRSAPVDTSWGTTLDVNGDGYADVAVSAPSTNSHVGQVAIYLGSAAGVAATSAAVLPGQVMASAGDVNGDGFGDLVIGLDGGEVAIYLGGPSGLSTAPDITLSTPPSAAYFGGPVAGVGDINRDGYADLVVGGSLPNHTGAVYVFLGSANGPAAQPSASLIGTTPYDHFGFALASAGDVNGDGYGDVVVGDTWNSTATGHVYVYLGGAGGVAHTPIATFTGTLGDGLGQALSTPGDVNGDGYADLLIGAFQTAGGATGAAYIYPGQPGGVGASPMVTLLGTLSFATSVAIVGDVDGDGFSDVAIGAPTESGAQNSFEGRVYLYAGGVNGPSASPSATLSSTGTYLFGAALGGPGDVNGDSLADIIIGAPGLPSQCVAPEVDFFLGAIAGVGSTPSMTLTGPDGSCFGAALARRNEPPSRREPTRHRFDSDVCVPPGQRTSPRRRV
jgi:hypothetical protein